MSRLYSYLQAALSWTLSGISRLRSRTITDSGTLIDLRSEVFEDVIPKGGIGVEIGVFKGTLSQYILKANQPSRLHLIDPWWKYGPEWHWAIGDKSTVRSFAAMLLVLQKPIESRQVEIHIDGSIEALKCFDHDYLDWAYIDSTHEYEQTKQELAILKTKVKPQGIIAGDDWVEDESDRHHGVCKAVQEFLSVEPEYNLIFLKGRQWAISKR